MSVEQARVALDAGFDSYSLEYHNGAHVVRLVKGTKVGEGRGATEADAYEEAKGSMADDPELTEAQAAEKSRLEGLSRDDLAAEAEAAGIEVAGNARKGDLVKKLLGASSTV